MLPLDIPSKACSTFIASLALVSKYGMPPLDWQKAMARFPVICSTISTPYSRSPAKSSAYHSLRLLHIHLVAEHHLCLVSFHSLITHATTKTYERESLRIHRARLYQEFVPPTIQRLETLRVIDIVHQNAAVGASIEGNTQRLEALLSCRIPDLCLVSHSELPRRC